MTFPLPTSPLHHRRLAGGKGAPEWAALPEDRAEEEDEADWSEEEDEGGSGYAEPAAPSASASAATSARRRIERSTAPVALESGALAPGRLSIRRVKDANAKEPARGVVTSVQFHPTGALVMVGSLDKTLRFFEADGQRNRKLASVHFPDMPVMDARLGGDGLTAFAVGRRPHYYTYDIPSATPTRIPALQGRGDRSLESFAVSPVAGAPVLAFLVGDGDVVLASTATRQPVGVMRASSAARAAAFTPDGSSLLTACDDGLVHVWDVRTQRLRGRFEDEGMQAASSLAVSPGGDTIAVGSDAGIVNIYGTADVEAAMAGFADGPRGRPGAPSGPFRRAVTVAPRKVLTQITTRISGVTFNHDGSILAMASHTVADRLRLVHTGTMTAFGNWPTARTPLGYVRAAAFSPTGDRLAVGNDKGRVLLLRMPFFDDK